MAVGWNMDDQKEKFVKPIKPMSNNIPPPKDEKTLDALNKYQEIAKMNSKITTRVETIDKFN